jgi:hypothetical protein
MKREGVQWCRGTWVQLVSNAIGFDELLLHGETRPFDVSSSQSNQRVFLRTKALFRPTVECKGLRWEKRSQSLARLRILLECLPAMPASIFFERTISVTHCVAYMLTRE